MTMLKKRPFAAAAAGVAALALLVGCSSGSGEPASTSSPGGGETAAVDISKSLEFVEPFFQPPTSVGTDVKVSTPPSGDFRIAFISCNLEVCLRYQEAGAEAAAAVGWTGEGIPFDGTPEDLLEKVQYAIDQGFNGIAVNGVDTATFSAAFDAAEKAGVVIVAGATASQPGGPVIAAQDGLAEFDRFGQIIGHFIVADSEGDANVLAFGLANFPIQEQTSASIVSTVRENCATCQAEEVWAQAADIGTALPNIIVSELQRRPDVNYISFNDGVMASGVVAALREAGLTDRVKIVGGNASPEVLANIRDGSQHGYIQFSSTYFAWQAVDAFVRHQAGDAQISPWEMPHQILTAETIGSESDEDLIFNLPRDMADQFLTLWGVK